MALLKDLTLGFGYSILNSKETRVPRIKKRKISLENSTRKNHKWKRNLIVDVPNSAFLSCKCYMNCVKCNCGFKRFIKHYERRIQNNLDNELHQIRLQQGSSNVRDVLNYKYPGEYESVIVDYYYENESKPIHLQRKRMSPFDLLSPGQLERIIQRMKL